MVLDFSNQRIARLTPLRELLALIESRVGAVEPRRCPLAAAHGRTLAETVVVPELPPHPIALRDGFAVASAAVVDAGPYAPLPLASVPHRVDAGEPMPRGTDAVLPLDAVMREGNRTAAIAAVAPGEGVLAAGGDATPDTALRCSGERLRALDIAVLAAVGTTDVLVREPRIHIACGSAARTPLIDAALSMLAHAATTVGGSTFEPEPGTLESALKNEGADTVIALGGTGSGRRDAGVQTLARLGRVEAHGIAVSPGETAAFGFVGARPVLLIPGRLDAALALWLLIGRHLIARLAGAGVEDPSRMLPLRRKVTSAIGLTELMPVRVLDGMAEPLACGYLSFQALGRSDGWIVVAAESEGFGAGTPLAVRPWP